MVEGTTTGKKVGFIQMKPNCAEGFVYSENENNCVAAPVKAEGDDKPKKMTNQRTRTKIRIRKRRSSTTMTTRTTTTIITGRAPAEASARARYPWTHVVAPIEGQARGKT